MTSETECIQICAAQENCVYYLYYSDGSQQTCRTTDRLERDDSWGDAHANYNDGLRLGCKRNKVRLNGIF